MKLSILIPSLASRNKQLEELRLEIQKQELVYGLSGKVEVLTHVDNGELTIGQKRNELMKRAKGEYVCFVDDDDMLSKNYLKLIFEKIMPDCCSLTGVITWDGNNPELFVHSLKYKEYKTNDHNNPKYERYPNHLNVIKRSIASKYKFPSINHGEDTDFATQLFNSGDIKNEAEIKDILYYYKFKTNK